MSHNTVGKNTEEKKWSVGAIVLGLIVAIPIVAIVGMLILGLVVGRAMNGPEYEYSNEEIPPEVIEEAPPVLDIADLGTPTLVTAVAEDHETRFLEIELFLPPGDGDLQFAIDNPFPVAVGYAGLAVRNESQAILVRTGETTILRRPDNCADGCRTYVWVTMYHGFQAAHPDAVLYAFAGEGAQVTIEEIPFYPPQMFR